MDQTPSNESSIVSGVCSVLESSGFQFLYVIYIENMERTLQFANLTLHEYVSLKWFNTDQWAWMCLNKTIAEIAATGKFCLKYQSSSY